MDGEIRVVQNQRTTTDYRRAALFGGERAEMVQKFHRSLPAYESTDLKRLDGAARYLGIGSLHVKDESTRFGLNAFKGLGGSYCIGRYIGERCGIGEEELTYQELRKREVQERTKGLTFVTATDGNHGRGIAWMARELGLKAVVYMPKGSARERLLNIRRLGAEAEITDLDYDDTVRFVASLQEEKGWILMQDTAWEGYEKIPTWIMQGYTTMAAEAVCQLGEERPTHVFLQAGVGAMSGAVAAFFADRYREARPKIVIVEPDRADCIYQTARADDGRIHKAEGDLDTIMAGLACGEPCTVGWEMLERYGDYFVSIPDYVAAKGMRMLGAPIPGDEQIISGESGAATAGLVAELMTRTDLDALRREIGLGPDSKVLCFSTEGDTDPEAYRRILWDGGYPSVQGE